MLTKAYRKMSEVNDSTKFLAKKAAITDFMESAFTQEGDNNPLVVVETVLKEIATKHLAPVSNSKTKEQCIFDQSLFVGNFSQIFKVIRDTCKSKSNALSLTVFTDSEQKVDLLSAVSNAANDKIINLRELKSLSSIPETIESKLKEVLGLVGDITEGRLTEYKNQFFDAMVSAFSIFKRLDGEVFWNNAFSEELKNFVEEKLENDKDSLIEFFKYDKEKENSKNPDFPESLKNVLNNILQEFVTKQLASSHIDARTGGLSGLKNGVAQVTGQFKVNNRGCFEPVISEGFTGFNRLDQLITDTSHLFRSPVGDFINKGSHIGRSVSSRRHSASQAMTGFLGEMVKGSQWFSTQKATHTGITWIDNANTLLSEDVEHQNRNKSAIKNLADQIKGIFSKSDDLRSINDSKFFHEMFKFALNSAGVDRDQFELLHNPTNNVNQKDFLLFQDLSFTRLDDEFAKSHYDSSKYENKEFEALSEQQKNKVFYNAKEKLSKKSGLAQHFAKGTSITRLDARGNNIAAARVIQSYLRNEFFEKNEDHFQLKNECYERISTKGELLLFARFIASIVGDEVLATKTGAQLLRIVATLERSNKVEALGDNEKNEFINFVNKNICFLLLDVDNNGGRLSTAVQETQASFTKVLTERPRGGQVLVVSGNKKGFHLKKINWTGLLPGSTWKKFLKSNSENLKQIFSATTFSGVMKADSNALLSDDFDSQLTAIQKKVDALKGKIEKARLESTTKKLQSQLIPMVDLVEQIVKKQEAWLGVLGNSNNLNENGITQKIEELQGRSSSSVDAAEQEKIGAELKVATTLQKMWVQRKDMLNLESRVADKFRQVSETSKLLRPWKRVSLQSSQQVVNDQPENEGGCLQ